VELRRTAGSVENLERLLRGEVDVAFVQGGTYPLVKDADGRLRGMAALYHEPPWIFYRGKPVTDNLGALAGRRIAVGAPGSGTEAIARAHARRTSCTLSVRPRAPHSRRWAFFQRPLSGGGCGRRLRPRARSGSGDGLGAWPPAGGSGRRR
jgi:hypothetical protein